MSLEVVTKQLNAHLIQYFKDKAESDVKFRAADSAIDACMQATADLSKRLKNLQDIVALQDKLIKDYTTRQPKPEQPKSWWEKLLG